MQVDIVFIVPSLIEHLSKSSDVDNYNLDSLKFIYCAGAPLHNKIIKKVKGRYCMKFIFMIILEYIYLFIYLYIRKSSFPCRSIISKLLNLSRWDYDHSMWSCIRCTRCFNSIVSNRSLLMTIRSGRRYLPLFSYISTTESPNSRFLILADFI